MKKLSIILLSLIFVLVTFNSALAKKKNLVVHLNNHGLKITKVIKKVPEMIGAIGGAGMEFNNIPIEIELYKFDLNNLPENFKNAKKTDWAWR